jgi:hypothetical protein
MPDFGSISPQKPMVYLESPTASNNITWNDAEAVVKYLGDRHIECRNLVAISTQAVPYEKKWIVDNGFPLDKPFNIQFDTVVNDNMVSGHNVATLAANLERDPKWAYEMLLSDHGVVQPATSQWYVNKFPSVYQAIVKLF